MGFDRRRFLAGAGGLAGLAVLAQSTPGVAATPPLPGHPFTLGIASGEPEPGGVVLWTRLAPDPLAEDGLGGMPDVRYPVRWEVSENDSMTRIVRRGTVWALPELAHSVHVEVRGLRPGRDYWYRFAVRGELSEVGHTRTAAARHESTPFTLAFASCQAWDAGFFTAYRHLAEQDLDVVVHLGDWIYENQLGATGGVRGVPLTWPQRLEPMSLDQYRIRHALVATDPDLRAARRVLPFVATVDDHEVKNNWSAETEPTAPTPENFLRRKAWGLRAFYEHMPLRAAALPRGTDNRLYRRLRFGRHGMLHLLDERQYRDAQDIAARQDPSRTMLGAEQEEWLLDGLGRSHATWNVIGNQVLMAQLDRLTDPGLQQLNPDTWDGYAASRDRLLTGIVDRRVRNPIVITGDAHVNCAAELKADFSRPDSPTVAPEFLGTSITSGGNGTDLGSGGREWLAANPHLKFVNSQRGYVRCRADADEWRADYLVLDKVTEPGGVMSTRTSFVVESGRPDLQEA
ncbi:alkaline phosphatase D family protein [Actinophytocola gossypii]|uniref:Alkaline phosphatase D family protein n=1 Tax=Actinophytocola gossypii TaxID=2812003 RepID=A0ABT2J540_9PSEU|nr:alkaline phosphatase D family protein [Actinophytocola gossypii]MCT2582988.1 alkaline phosphatase D family protein [Actinophytocola gossypii]